VIAVMRLVHARAKVEIEATAVVGGRTSERQPAVTR
jgi:hypothetical protein